MLGYDEFGQATNVVVLLVDGRVGVVFRTMDKGYEVSVLLYGSGLTQVGEDGSLVVAGGSGAVELREGYDRNVQLLGQCLERARYGADLLFARTEFHACGVHQLQVVDDDYLHVMLAYETARLGAQLRDGESRSFVDIHRGSVEVFHTLVELIPLVVGEAAGADCLALDFADIGYHTVHELYIAHLQRENAYRYIEVHRHVFGHGQYERRLAHGRTRRYDDKVGVLPSRSHGVQSGIACRQAREAALAVGGGLNLLHGLADDGVYLHDLAFELRLRNLKQLSLGGLQQVVYVIGLVESLPLDVGSESYQTACQIFLGYDAGVELDVCR